MFRESSPRKEKNLLIPLSVLGLLAVSLFSFTRKQRESVVNDRDGGRCQFPGKHNCKGKLQLHHIIPQRYAKDNGIDPDFSNNGITLCENVHVGSDPKVIHPDMSKARKGYGKNQKSFQVAFDERDKKIQNREIYWNDSHDRQMSATAVRNTQRAEKRGWKFPLKRSQK